MWYTHKRALTFMSDVQATNKEDGNGHHDFAVVIFVSKGDW